MKNLLCLLLISIFGFANTNSSCFDDSAYINEAWVAEMLGSQFVKDIDSPALNTTMEDFMSNHFDAITHISGYYAKETDMYYYAVFGMKDGAKKADYLEVSKDHFSAGTYYDYQTKLELGSLCRRGNGYPHWRICPGYSCENHPPGCLGIICSRYECSDY